MAVVFVFFLTIFGLAFYRLAETDIDLIGNDRATMEALYAAQAGIEKAAWIVKHHRAIEAGSSVSVNPFSTAFYDTGGPILEDFQQVADNNQAFLSPGGSAFDRYFRINLVDARGLAGDEQRLMDKLKVQVLGALDIDGDGSDGLTATDDDGFPIDRDDVSRKFEAVIGLPGSLAHGLSAGAPSITYGDGSTPINFGEKYEALVTQDGYTASGFRFYQSGTLGNWDQYRYIFGKSVRQGEIELPSGLFDEAGTPQLAYFSGLDLTPYDGDQIFDRLNDPTAADGASIIFVDGNVTIQDVDFGYVDSNGVLRDSDWVETDVTIISTGTTTVKDVQCGDVGRLTLIAQNIRLIGDYDTRINGIALASGTVTFDDREDPGDPSGCEHEVLKDGTDPSWPLRYSAYFMGTVLAGTEINLRNAGWTVLFDEKVINGLMYDGTLSKPTVVYETAENENGDFPEPKWKRKGGELFASQRAYTPEEITSGVAASWDEGTDPPPNLMGIDQRPDWRTTTDDHDFGVTDDVELDFEDGGMPLQDWTNYRALNFWMSLDNFRRVNGSRETVRMVYFRVRLEDGNSTAAYFNPPPALDGFYLSERNSGYDNIENPRDGAWKKVRIPLAGTDPLGSFKINIVDEVVFYLDGFLLSWYDTGGSRQWIDHDPGGGTGYGEDGRYVFHEGGNEHSVRFWEMPDERHRLYYTTGGDPYDKAIAPDDDPNDEWILWNPDPTKPTVMEPVYFEDHLNPTMRVDQIHIPGRPASNASLEYGLPRGFRYAVTHLTEHKTF